MFITALSTIARSNKGMDKEEVVHVNNEILPRHKNIAIMPFVTTWMDLEKLSY